MPTNLPLAAPIRVLVVDDSAFMRFAISQQLNQDEQITVVGAAPDGREALRQIPLLLPDVITLDVEMPRMDGLTALREIMRLYPRPVLMFSSLTQQGAAQTLEALNLGAVDFIPKPQNRVDIRAAMSEMSAKIKAAAQARVRTSPPAPAFAAPAESTPKSLRPYDKIAPLLCIAASTGGPRALQEIIPALPANLPAPVLIIQHMPAGFTRSLAERLNNLSALRVKEAEAGDALLTGQALLAPGGFHLTLDEEGRVQLNQKPPVHGVRPAVDVTLHALHAHFGSNLLAVILTGMGTDGTYSAAALHNAGGYVIAEDESTCAVWGMPRSVVEAGAADAILPRPQIAAAIQQHLTKGKTWKQNSTLR